MKVNTSRNFGPILGLLILNALVEAAPAPQVVTIWQTATQVTNDDGSLYTYVAPDQDTTTNVVASTTQVLATSSALATAATSTPTSTSASSSSSGSSGKFSGYFEKLLSYLHDSSSSSSTAATTTSSAASTPTTTSASAATTTSASKNWLDLLFGNDDDSSSSSSSTSATSSAIATATATSSTSSLGSTSTSDSTSSSTASGDVYAAIYDSDDIDELFAKDILDAHNKYRALHGVAALSWSTDTYKYAKNNADDYDCSGVLTHTHGQFGENLAAGFATGPAAVKAWYDEGDSYDYSVANTYDHFTQVVWKGSTTVGCAYKDCSLEGWQKYVVCEYDPPGNVIGYNSKNVLPLTSSS